ncbi:cell division protein FtsL [Desulfobotulus sp. H1]|uniref:Cell division protein FtsL n=1 Tax=Desulfobotulus pelophilus TaxID=2823377 RepID=A0ABT3N518_9BACT|nr:cell division protein FtsL [Desulfobotulus pelophilus]MCW7752561.1 cell division protein FtsL [Desulfobotulus pelophilus]
MKQTSNPPGPMAWLLLLGVFFITVFSATWIRTQCTSLNFSISLLREERDRLITQNRNLEIEQARLRSPERIRNLAENRLGLVMPKAENTVDLTGIVHEKDP